MNTENEKASRRNFIAFVWHAVFLALTKNFADINTVIPTMLIRAGGTTFHLGLLTAIMVGGNSFMQLFFASFLTHKRKTRKYLLTGIYLRVSALLVLGFLLMNQSVINGRWVVLIILFLMTVFSFSGAFAGIAYNDILGKSINVDSRKRFFIVKQTLASTAVLASALAARKILGYFDYPANYSLLFLLAGFLLLVGTAGFWAIREKENSFYGKLKLKERLSLFKAALVGDRNLRNYLFMVNTSSLGIAVIPFLIALAKKNFGLSGSSIGNYLLLQVAGMIVSNLLFRALAKGNRYKGILALHIIAGALLPVAALLLQQNESMYMVLFPLSGLVLASKEIAIPGILLEISNNENRAIYSGISGAGSIASIIFPIAAGVLISMWGFTPVFIAAAVIIVSGFIFSNNIDCTPIDGGLN